MPTPDIDAAEVLFRQIGSGGNPIYFDPSRTPAIHQSRFLPTKQDIDGLSLIRSRFRTHIWAAYRPEKDSERFRLACLKVDTLRQKATQVGLSSLSFNATADSLDERFGAPWAHCVAAEINYTTYSGDSEAKKRIKEWAMKVAEMLTVDDVIGPFDKPTQSDPYRP
jgi:hypothetical protein